MITLTDGGKWDRQQGTSPVSTCSDCFSLVGAALSDSSLCDPLSMSPAFLSLFFFFADGNASVASSCICRAVSMPGCEAKNWSKHAPLLVTVQQQTPTLPEGWVPVVGPPGNSVTL